MILPTSHSSKHQPNSHQMLIRSSSSNQKNKRISKVMTVLGAFLGLSTLAHAQLPAPIETVLNRANISSDDISLIIMPVNSAPNSNSQAANDADVQSMNTESDASKAQTNAQQSKPQKASRLPAVVLPEPRTEAEITVDRTDALPPEDATDAEGLLKKNTAADRASAQPLTMPIRHLSNVPRTPASTMKLIPTFIALDMLGPDFVWFTKAYYTGYVSANTLYGDLIIKGGGDPKLTHRRLSMLLDQVQKAGIRHIKGDIVLDSSVFQDVGKDPAAFDNDPLRPYNASPDGLLINFNTIEMTTIPLQNDSQQGIAKAFYKPNLADYDLPQTLHIRNSGRCSSIRYSLAPTWQNERLAFGKALPEDCGAHTFYIAYPDVKDFAQRVVKQKWLSLGNTMSGNIKFLGLGNTLAGDTINTEYPLKTRFGTYLDMSKTGSKHELLSGSLSIIPSSPLPLVSYPSLPLSQQIYDINHYSNNVMTEQVTLSLPLFEKAGLLTEAAQEKNQIAPPTIVRQTQSDYTKALATIGHWWQRNLQTPPPVMTNGSGLCRDCSVTADNLAELLEVAYAHPHFDTYVNSLGIAGVSGTITEHADRLPNSKAVGRAWIKTGTLNNVTSMAGYVHGLSGQDYVVVGIINGSNTLNTYQARYALDTMLDWTAQH